MDTPPPLPLPPMDLLSSLPEHVQDEILKRLNLRDAVRTSGLSRAWRRRWETIHGLPLSFPKRTPPLAIDHVLLRYAGRSVSQFACHVNMDRDDDSDSDDDVDASASAAHVAGWLVALSRRRVKSISVIKYGARILTLHSSIFSCRRLVSLHLEHCLLPPFPHRPVGGGGGFAAGGFPLLKNLYLTSVEFADNGQSQLRAMIRASPMLGVLMLKHVDAGDMDRVIEAPNLRSLVLVSSTNGWRFGELPRLLYASLQFAGLEELLTGVSHVQKLTLYLPSFYFKMEAIPFTFHNLKSLELSACFSGMDQILSMFCLLRSSPNLEKLKIKVRPSKLDADEGTLNAQWTDGMCANLQVVQFTSYNGWLPLPFIEHILSKASSLCTLSVDACPASQDDPLNELLNCRKASPRAQVLFKVQ